MSKGPGIVQRAVRQFLTANQDSIFTIESLCRHVYQIEKPTPVEKKHRVAVERALASSWSADWSRRRSWLYGGQGGPIFYYNLASLPSRIAMAKRSHDSEPVDPDDVSLHIARRDCDVAALAELLPMEAAYIANLNRRARAIGYKGDTLDRQPEREIIRALMFHVRRHAVHPGDNIPAKLPAKEIVRAVMFQVRQHAACTVPSEGPAVPELMAAD